MGTGTRNSHCGCECVSSHRYAGNCDCYLYRYSLQRNTVDASLIVTNLRHVDGVTNEEVARQMSMFQEGASRVPQAV